MSRPKRDGTAYARYSARSAGPATACAAISSALGHTEATALSSTCSTAQLSKQSVTGASKLSLQLKCQEASKI